MNFDRATPTKANSAANLSGVLMRIATTRIRAGLTGNLDRQKNVIVFFKD